jgi:hypothetical protein
MCSYTTFQAMKCQSNTSTFCLILLSGHMPIYIIAINKVSIKYLDIVPIHDISSYKVLIKYLNILFSIIIRTYAHIRHLKLKSVNQNTSTFCLIFYQAMCSYRTFQSVKCKSNTSTYCLILLPGHVAIHNISSYKESIIYLDILSNLIIRPYAHIYIIAINKVLIK